jgi:periplasmic divalent cation tolerance protein
VDQNNKGGSGDMVEKEGSPSPAAVLVYATFPGREAAMATGQRLIEARLAACINIIPSMTSIYRWNGAIETADEAVLIAKLPASNASAVVAAIVAGHPYDIPAVLVIPVIAGAAGYLTWIVSETASPSVG